jgi:hypothetical protein
VHEDDQKLTTTTMPSYRLRLKEPLPESDG